MAVKSALMAKSLELMSERSLLGKFRGCLFVIDCYGEDFTAGIGNNLVYNLFLEYGDGGTMGDLIKQSGGSGLCELPSEEVYRIKIGDLGLAKRAVGKRSCRGTAMSLSPETVLDSIQEKPSDIWALGCVVLKMLTGRHPWDAKASAKLHDLKPLIASRVPKVPGGLSEDARDFLKNCFACEEPFTEAHSS
ncbi:mitogen-activated protein kinase kinase kinase YODA-like [Prunus yedoensis var. nudiflora]|uniref:Mitogen-activated protein kinase kinase kinase YODA-like n=1 Tax=Prunus yedoensis var. nudiflora TaxID=2094558 RepID=A0A314YRD3_PRUYE|nr:mitogen-activated protein kinase kinase kinase YODA-like [Prunus yedoensis var. nudiflora]